MWHSGSKYQRIRALMKASRKQLKTVQTSGVRNFCPASIASKLVKFPLFNNFFLDLAKFRDLNVFSDFLACSTPPTTPNSLTSPSSTPSYSKINLFGDTVVFSIKVSRAIILLKPWMNC